MYGVGLTNKSVHITTVDLEMILAINHTEINVECRNRHRLRTYHRCNKAGIVWRSNCVIVDKLDDGLKALWFAKSAARKCELLSYACKGLDNSLVVECRLTFSHLPDSLWKFEKLQKNEIIIEKQLFYVLRKQTVALGVTSALKINRHTQLRNEKSWIIWVFVSSQIRAYIFPVK